VKTNFRTAITVPERSWERFRDYFAVVCEKISRPSQLAEDGGGVTVPLASPDKTAADQDGRQIERQKDEAAQKQQSPPPPTVISHPSQEETGSCASKEGKEPTERTSAHSYPTGQH
ncbi:unnamed protein product, partial [Soboliphyme baturini]|uniref:Myotubularin phosphatase domain-containing protein n=1 Tax=Soboliphyme baturini TaxID=241478 RepID=A0A183IUZ5_9BILA